MNKYHNNSSNINKPINKKINTINNNCKYCNKILSDRKSRWKHEQTCKTKKSELNDIKKEFFKLKEEVLNQKEEILNQKEEILNQKEEIINLKKEKKINKKIINNNNTNNTNNINNGTINNTYNIVQLGNENFNDILTDLQKIYVLENSNPSKKLVELVYTNDEFKKYRNVRISNLSSDNGQIYSEKDKRFITKMKDFIMKKCGWNRRADVEEMVNYIQEKKIKLKNMKDIQILIDTKYNDNEYIKNNNKDILHTMYDYCFKLDIYLNK